jgi:hypothetical protein
MSQTKFNVRRIHSTTGKKATFTIVRLYLKTTFELAVGPTVNAGMHKVDEKSPVRRRYPHGVKRAPVGGLWCGSARCGYALKLLQLKCN